MADQPCSPEKPELMRDGRLADAENLRDVADAQFAAGQDIEDPYAGRVAEDLEGFGKPFDQVRFQQLCLQALNI